MRMDYRLVLTLLFILIFTSLNNFRKYTCDLLLQKKYQLLLHLGVEPILKAEFASQVLRCISLIDNDSLHASLFANVNVNI